MRAQINVRKALLAAAVLSCVIMPCLGFIWVAFPGAFTAQLNIDGTSSCEFTYSARGVSGVMFGRSDSGITGNLIGCGLESGGVACKYYYAEPDFTWNPTSSAVTVELYEIFGNTFTVISRPALCYVGSGSTYRFVALIGSWNGNFQSNIPAVAGIFTMNYVYDGPLVTYVPASSSQGISISIILVLLMTVLHAAVAAQ